jgi:hypothetical protein
MEGATVIRPIGNPFWYHHLAPMGGACLCVSKTRLNPCCRELFALLGKLNVCSHSNAISHALCPFQAGAIGATVQSCLNFYAMTNDPASTVLTDRSKGSDRTFKAIEYMRLSSHDHVKGLIVFITTYFTLCHAQHSFLVALSSSFSPHHGQYDTYQEKVSFLNRKI